MIEKMRFVSIIGPKDDIDRVTDTYLSKYDIHLENTLTELNGLKNIHPFLEANPYQQLQRNVSELQQVIKFEPENKKNISIQEASSIIVNAYEKLLQHNEQLEELQKKRALLDENINIVAPFRQLSFGLSNVLNFKFIKYRFGKMSHEHYEQFMKYEYDKLNVIFIESNIDENYVWGIYFTPAILKDKADAIFSSLHFERIIIPDDYSGTAEESYNKYCDELKKVDSEIEKITLNFKEYLNSIKDDLSSAANIINKYSHNREIRKMAACTIDTSNVLNDSSHSTFYIICGWMVEQDAARFQADVEDDPNVFCLIEETTHLNVKPPTKLKNPGLFKPFEMFVEMYGLPNYNEIDPTIFLAVTYSILFGLMFGDVGQGLLLMIGGFLLYKFKRINIAGIISLAGVFSTIFGFVYGSVFGFEDILKPLWISPMNNVMTILITTVAFGVCLNLVAMILNIINGVKNKNVEKIFFDTNGMAGFIFYSIVIICIVLFFLGYKLPATWILVICLGLPLLAIFLREPLTNLINKKPELIEGSKGMFFVESFFELFEILLSFLTNSLSFVRVGAFALSHAGLMSVVLMLAKAETAHPNIVVLVIGNLFVMGLEALSVAIQVLRLQFYEMFSRYYGGDGKPFKSYLTNK